MAQALGEDLVQPGELQDDSSSLGSDSELSGPGPYRQADRYGFIGGSSAEPGPGHPPADLIRQREMKWVEMTSHWEKTMSRRYKKWMETIGRDLHRQFPLHEMFVSPQGHGQQGLLQVLKAYTLYRPEQGYCQAQGPVAAVLLMYLPPEVFTALLRRLLPRVHKHLQQVGVGPLLYLPEWFLCLFARSLPFPTVLRVWDAFLSEGEWVAGQLQEEAFMPQVHSVALSEQDLQREIKTQLAQLPAAPRIESPARSHRGSTSSLDTRF
ncbi:hypothetical protein E2I00_011610 [Balaenoptera physalus]|uniref:Rab-GAP TBC domain-containing protein n=1 Tax=Balaenoptera physalus TaxID=9770 RepID=A0A643BQ41_BALPH|nr:hypothetical protein E2I00_011610 [Balaenoptera physalus]